MRSAAREPAIRRTSRLAATTLLVVAAIGLRFSARAPAAPVSLSGTISYQGAYSGDTLFVAALDTTGAMDPTVLDLKAIAVGSSPFSQPYSLDFDNAGIGPDVLVASFLDVDGGGVDSISGSDVFGWYAGEAVPVSVSTDSSRSGIDFALPRAEIHGTITLTATQTEARVDVSVDPTCVMEGFRPPPFATSSGPYAIIGVYPGTYCVSATGQDASGLLRVCHGDPACASPALITLGEDEMRNGVDLDFTMISPVEAVSWGGVKALYR